MKNTLLLVLWLCMATTLVAQQDIEYDFMSKTVRHSDEKRQENTFFRIKVTNVNLFLYKVEVNATNREFNKQVPELITKLLGPSGVTTNSPLGREMLGRQLNNKANQRSISNSDSIKLVNQWNDLFSLDKSLHLKSQKIYDPKHKYDPKEAITAKEIETYYNLLQKVELMTLLEGYESIKSYFDGLNFRERLDKYLLLSQNCVPENFTYISAPLLAKPDEMEFFLRISPRDTGNDLIEVPLQTDSLRFRINVKRSKPSLSFSTGIFVSGLQNEQYGYLPTLKQGSKTDIDYYTIASENLGKISVGFNSLVHFTTAIAGQQAGLHLGFGIPLDPAFNLFGFYGISLPFGQKERIILNIGGVSGSVKRLSKNALTGQQFKDNKIEIPLSRQLAHSLSMSLTFNFYNK